MDYFKADSVSAKTPAFMRVSRVFERKPNIEPNTLKMVVGFFCCLNFKD